MIIRDNSGRAVLEVKQQTVATQIYKDERTFIWDYLAIWEPQPEQGFWMLGHKAQGNWDDMQGHVLMAKDIVGDIQGRYMRNPVDFDEIWRDEGGFGIYDVSFWRPICPEGFFSLGDITNSCEWCGWPKPLSYLSRMKCVSLEIAEECSVQGSPLWTNDGGWENERGSVWEMTAEGGMSTFFLANSGWSQPQNGRGHCLKQAEFVGGTVNWCCGLDLNKVVLQSKK